MKVADVANVSIVIKVYFGGFVQPICKNRAVFLGENGLSGGGDFPQIVPKRKLLPNTLKIFFGSRFAGFHGGI